MNNDPYNTSDRNAAPPHDPSSTPQSSQTSFTHVQSTPFTFTPKPKPAYKPLDALFAWLSIAVGFLLVKAMPVTKSTLGGMLFLCLLYCFGGLYLYLCGVRIGRKAVLFAAIMLVLSLGMITGGNSVIKALLFLGVIGGCLIWLYFSAGLGDERHLDGDLIRHASRAIFSVPFTSLEHIFPALISFRKNRTHTKKLLHTIGWILAGLGIAVIPTAIVVALLSYDAQFTSLLNRIFSISLDGVWETLRDLFFGFLCAIFLFGTLFGLKWRRDSDKLQKEPLAKTDLHVVPKALLCAAATPVLAVYVIFFISQWEYYVSAFTHVLPGDLTYAAYAREGFFQLCVVSGLNALLLLLFNLLIRRKEDRRDVLQTVYSAVISLFTLILIATALSKMLLYIDFYGLTQKRVYASWLMLLLAVIFVLVIVAQFVKKLRLLPSILLTCLAFVTILVLPDVDGMIASYNVDAYLDGKLNTVDIASLSELGTSSVPALIRLEKELSKTEELSDESVIILQKTSLVLTRINAKIDTQGDGFFAFNIPDARAKSLLKQRNSDLDG